MTVAQENLKHAKINQKKYYDEKAKSRDIKEGDEVLLLQPTSNKKLMMQWKGPYKVQKKLNGNNFLIRIRNKEKLYHINILKIYHRRKSDPYYSLSSTHVAMAVVEDTSEEIIDPSEGAQVNTDEIPTLEVEKTENFHGVLYNQEFPSHKRKQVESIVGEFKNIFSNTPGQTDIVEHEINLITDVPVYTKPYQIPYSTRETLKREEEQERQREELERERAHEIELARHRQKTQKEDK